MSICINCGNEAEGCLCAKCRETVNIEELCNQLVKYRPGFGDNILWDSISESLSDPDSFRNNTIFAVADNLPSPRKEYVRIMSMAGDKTYVVKSSRPWLYEAYEVCKNEDGLSEYELNRIKGLVLDALYKDYMYTEADELATDLMGFDRLPKQVYFTVADFYTKTRRYDKADDLLSEAAKLFGGDQDAVERIKELTDENNKRRDKPYMPASKDNKDAIIDFLATLGIEAEVPSRAPEPMPKDTYPDPIETRDPGFTSFVAFDLETTGRNSDQDSIIEFGAIKVVDGQVVVSGEFVFQEFAKPYKKKLSEEIQKLTGITVDDVKNAREMWEVTPDFLKFVGDSILVGFNCIAFDGRFMKRAGRYSNIIIENKYFDVMRYADQFKERLGIESKKISLEELSSKLNIENPEAHRALADAITTARVFLKLKEMDDGAASSSLDDILSGFEDF